MAYEVWMFEQQPEGPSKLISVATPPPSYSHGDIILWARQQEELYAGMGLGVTSIIREEASY